MDRNHQKTHLHWPATVPEKPTCVLLKVKQGAKQNKNHTSSPGLPGGPSGPRAPT